MHASFGDFNFMNGPLDNKQAFLSAIIESSDDAIISKNLDGYITSWNRGAEKIFGYTEQEALGRHITMIIPLDRQREEHLILSRIRSGQKVDHFQTIRVTKFGKEIPISLTVSPIRNPQGQIIGASKIARDISAEKQAQQEVQRLLQEIRIASQQKDEFIALASHELKTPLTSINGYLQVISKRTQEPFTKSFIDKAVQQIGKLNNLVSELLDISRIENGKLQLNYEIFDLNAFLVEIIDTYGYIFSSHTIGYAHPSACIWVNADKQRIEQVMINLISNAVKYSPSSDTISITLSATESAAMITVSDQGVGLSEEQQGNIFSRFYRAENNLKTSGLGLGLYLSKEIVERHQGRIGVKSEQGKGSEFYFTLPVYSLQDNNP